MPPAAHPIAGSCHFQTFRATGHIRRQLRPSVVSAEPSGSGNFLKDNPASRLISRLVRKEATDSDEQASKQSNIKTIYQLTYHIAVPEVQIGSLIRRFLVRWLDRKCVSISSEIFTMTNLSFVDKLTG